MNKGKLIVMTGLPGSGKSTIAREFGPVYSSDEIRKEFFGDASIQSHPASAEKYLLEKGIHLDAFKKSKQEKLIRKASNDLIFSELQKRIRRALENGESAVYDATNLTAAQRKKILQTFQDVSDRTISVYVKTSLKHCLSRNQARKRKVPKKVIQKMARQLEVPAKTEGFDEILVIEN